MADTIDFNGVKINYHWTRGSDLWISHRHLSSPSINMVNGLHLYSAFTDPMATKAPYILPHIHPIAGVRCLAHGHLVRWNRGLNHQPFSL